MLLYLLAAVFHLWMFYDALQKRVPMYWYLIIMFLPFGSVIYFLMIKLPQSAAEKAQESVPVMETGPALVDIAHAAEETPSFDNKLNLAKALFQAEHYTESEAVFAECLAIDEEDAEALYGLGTCKAQRNEHEEAADIFRKVVEHNSSFKDYAGWLDLAANYRQMDNHNEAVDTLKRLIEVSPRVKHKTILGRYLAELKQYEQAKQVLKQAIADYEESSLFLKRDNRDWAFEAREILGSLP